MICLMSEGASSWSLHRKRWRAGSRHNSVLFLNLNGTKLSDNGECVYVFFSLMIKIDYIYRYTFPEESGRNIIKILHTTQQNNIL